MMKIGTSTPPGDTAVFLDTAALSHMVTAESRLCQHVVNTTACSVRIKGAQHPKERSRFSCKMNVVSW